MLLIKYPLDWMKLGWKACVGHREKPGFFSPNDKTISEMRHHRQGLVWMHFKVDCLIIKASGWTTHLREGRWETARPQVLSSYLSKAFGPIPFEDCSLADSLILKHRQWQLPNLPASLTYCPKLTLPQDHKSGRCDPEQLLWQAGSLLNSSIHTL